jgi:hypothetical protein
MSRYEWEKGTLDIPSREWSAFRRAVVQGYNDHQKALYRKALRLYERITAQGKGKRGFDFRQALDEAMREAGVSVGWYQIKRALFPSGDDRRRPLKPKKKDFPQKPITKATYIPVGEAAIVLDPPHRRVTWDVPENNHAVSTAREHPVAQTLFRALDRVKWTKNSGGLLVGNDEYNRDCESVGSGGNYVTAEYGPSRKRRRRSGYPSYRW